MIDFKAFKQEITSIVVADLNQKMNATLSELSCHKHHQHPRLRRAITNLEDTHPEIDCCCDDLRRETSEALDRRHLPN